MKTSIRAIMAASIYSGLIQRYGMPNGTNPDERKDLAQSAVRFTDTLIEVLEKRKPRPKSKPQPPRTGQPPPGDGFTKGDYKMLDGHKRLPPREGADPQRRKDLAEMYGVEHWYPSDSIMLRLAPGDTFTAADARRWTKEDGFLDGSFSGPCSWMARQGWLEDLTPTHWPKRRTDKPHTLGTSILRIDKHGKRH